MLINFIGSPCSGKTTTAAALFAKLKDDGHSAEFIPEQARQYIATVRFNNLMQPTEPLKLDDVDQLRIMQKQADLERIMAYACGESVVIVSDSSALNALLYMNEERHQDVLVAQEIKRAMSKVDLVFYCPPVENGFLPFDPNRVHTLEESKVIDSKVLGLIERYVPTHPVGVLYGTPTNRLHLATCMTYKTMIK